MPKLSLRDWQREAMVRWHAADHRGIVSVVTGGGKTVFALSCIDQLQPDTSVVVVPTVALLDQWWSEAAAFFDLDLDEVHVVRGNGHIRTGTINLAVLNTASKLVERGRAPKCFLIVDECHKAASDEFRTVLNLPSIASLGLSATPERQYDDGLQQVLVPALGPIIFEYDYRDALRDGVIVPFNLRNIVFDLEQDRQEEYDKLTRTIARAIRKYGADAQETVALYLKRARVMNLSMERVRIALRLVAAHRGKRILIFHEDIEACNLIHHVLAENKVRAGLYHSKLTMRDRVQMLTGYRRGEIDVLVTCRALDEGFNVPETQIGIVAASTATRRQRIQRLGRILRPASGKDGALIYTLVATAPEVDRLKKEEAEIEGVAHVSWSRA
ncbi:MAG TPA: DEAD/DEAH box helicase [Bradyrhizobium sp.]|nr:DEAD/DEAH box helicase [Bradyrhizobium sp.]